MRVVCYTQRQHVFSLRCTGASYWEKPKEEFGMKKTQRAPLTIKRSRRLAAASILAALGLGVTSAYAWSGTINVTASCDSTGAGGAATFSGNVTDASSDSWKVKVTGPTNTSKSLGQDTTGAYKVTVDHLSVGSYSATLTSQDPKPNVTPVTFKIDACNTPPPPAPTPELGSGELLATGLLPIGAVLLYRRRRARRPEQTEATLNG